MHCLEIQGLSKDFCHNSRTSEHFGETHELQKKDFLIFFIVGSHRSLYDRQKGRREINEIYQWGNHKRLGRNGLST